LKKGNDMSKTATIYHRDGREKTVDVHEASRLAGAGTVGASKDWSFHRPPPPGWEREVPKYRVTRDVHPLPQQRSRFEPPHAMISDNDAWQYAERPVKAGDIIDTKEWPHPSFAPLNYGAERVLEFFNSRMKSRLTTSPWYGDGLRLDDGLTGNIIMSADPPQLKRMDLRPAS
jgi:hypothetical protein